MKTEIITAAEYREMSKKKAKYGQTRVVNPRGSFPSKLEAAVFELLRLRVMAGELDMLTRYDKVHFPQALTSWTIDFWAYDTKTGKPVWIESKGFGCARWNHFLKCYRKYGPGPLLIYSGSHKSPYLVNTIYPETIT